MTNEPATSLVKRVIKLTGISLTKSDSITPCPQTFLDLPGLCDQNTQVTATNLFLPIPYFASNNLCAINQIWQGQRIKILCTPGARSLALVMSAWYVIFRFQSEALRCGLSDENGFNVFTSSSLFVIKLDLTNPTICCIELMRTLRQEDY